MAERRMFAKKIVNSARFIKMPSSSRLLYYDLGMNADDEGVVEAFSIMKMTGATEDDLRVLISKGFVQVLNDELVTYIMDWNTNNLIRRDRYQESFYHELLIQMKSNGDDQKRLETIEDNAVNQRLTQYRLGKDSIGKDIDDDIQIQRAREAGLAVDEALEALSPYDYTIEEVCDLAFRITDGKVRDPAAYVARYKA